MGVYQFFRNFFPISKLDDLLEQVFTLTYCMKGMDYSSIMEMEFVEREWYLKRLSKQLKDEEKMLKKGKK